MSSDSFIDIEETQKGIQKDIQLEEKTSIKLTHTPKQELRTHLFLCMERLVDHFVICDLKNDRYEYYFPEQEQKQPITGKYSELIKQMSRRFKALEKSADLADWLSVKEHWQLRIWMTGSVHLDI